MKLKYCANCGSMELKKQGLQTLCLRCRHVGEPKEDSIDVINAFRKRLQGKTMNLPIQSGSGSQNSQETVSESKSTEQLKKKFSNSPDVEFV